MIWKTAVSVSRWKPALGKTYVYTKTTLKLKIPGHFKIEMPIGIYNSDWAVYIKRDGVRKMFFILETKGSTSMFDLPTAEQLKIQCGKQHFKALENGTELQVARA